MSSEEIAWRHINDRCSPACPYCEINALKARISALEAENKAQGAYIRSLEDANIPEINALKAELSALKEAMSIHQHSATYYQGIASRAILREAQRWVPVSERLPKKGTRVVVYIEPVIRERAYASLKATYETGEWPFCYGNRVITHWMPLPPAPEGIEK